MAAMHSDPTLYALTRASSLENVLRRLAEEPGQHTLLAGGTELMVAFNSGRLRSRALISIQALQELRFLRWDTANLQIGAGTTFTDLRRDEMIGDEFPLLAQAASWTGSIANQNRATIGGNICNASPAADTPPALLAYEAEVTLRSARGSRTIPYREFHLGYKQTALRSDELLYSITIPRRYAGWHQYVRKVGTREAQAISKVALAAVANARDGHIAELHLAAASLADRPLRLEATEQLLTGASLEPAALEETVRLARASLARESKPIDDIRSTARYRTTVAANLLEGLLRQLAADAG